MLPICMVRCPLLCKMWATTGAAMSPLRRLVPPALKPLLRRVVARLGLWPQRISVGPARGLWLYAPLGQRGSYRDGRHEPHIMAALAGWVRPGMVVCDVGAHLGYFTLALARSVGPAGHVYAFEPLLRHVGALRRTAALNRLAQVTVVPLAVGATAGTVTLEESSNDSMARVQETAATASARGHVVRRTTLDAWAVAAAPARLDLIKLDIEGQELAALTGARQLLATHRPAILCELHRGGGVPYRPADLVAWLHDAGYTVRLIPPPERPDQTLAAALAALDTATPRPGWMYVAHILAEPAARL